MPAICKALRERGLSAAPMQTEAMRYLTRCPHSPMRFYPSSWSDADVTADLFITLVTMSLSDHNVTGTTAPPSRRGTTRGASTSATTSIPPRLFTVGWHFSQRPVPFVSAPAAGARSLPTAREATAPSTAVAAATAWPRRNAGGSLAAELSSGSVPLEEAIDRIGPKYQRAIRQWYEEFGAVSR